jgi:hypothetical protein
MRTNDHLAILTIALLFTAATSVYRASNAQSEITQGWEDLGTTLPAGWGTVGPGPFIDDIGAHGSGRSLEVGVAGGTPGLRFPSMAADGSERIEVSFYGKGDSVRSRDGNAYVALRPHWREARDRPHDLTPAAKPLSGTFDWVKAGERGYWRKATQAKEVRDIRVSIGLEQGASGPIRDWRSLCGISKRGCTDTGHPAWREAGGTGAWRMSFECLLFAVQAEPLSDAGRADVSVPVVRAAIPGAKASVGDVWTGRQEEASTQLSAGSPRDPRCNGCGIESRCI